MFDNATIGDLLVLLFVLAVCLEFAIFCWKETKIELNHRREDEDMRNRHNELMEAQRKLYINQFDIKTDKGDRIDNGPIN